MCIYVSLQCHVWIYVTPGRGLTYTRTRGDVVITVVHAGCGKSLRKPNSPGMEAILYSQGWQSRSEQGDTGLAVVGTRLLYNPEWCS